MLFRSTTIHELLKQAWTTCFAKCSINESLNSFNQSTFLINSLSIICCPSLFQKLMYSGHKFCHGNKFQSVVTPDGLFASMYGLVSGNRHDSFLLSNSGLLNKLEEFMPDDAPEDIAACSRGHC